MGSPEPTTSTARSVSRDRAGRSTLPLAIARVLLVAAAYFVAARLGLRLAVIEQNVTPLWPPTGIALVAFLVLGRAVWPGVAIAAFAVNVPISENVLAAMATAAGNTLAPLVAATLLELVGFRREIDRWRDAIAIVFLGALLSMLISATVGATTLVVSGTIPGSEFMSAWAVWWAGDAMGVLVVAPFLLSVGFVREPTLASWPRRIEVAALFVVLAAVAFLVSRSDVPLMFVTLPLVGWAAWRFQQRGAAPAALLVAGIASWAAAGGAGPFGDGTLFERMLSLQAFNATVAFSSLFFAAVVTERMRARSAVERAAAELEDRVRARTSELSVANEQLRREVQEREAAEKRLLERERQLAEAQEVAQMGSFEWVISDDRVSWSDEMFRIHGFQPQEFPVTFDKAVELVVEEDLDRIRRRVQAALAARGDHLLPEIEYRIVRPDGAERMLLGRAWLAVGESGEPFRMVGTVQDVTESKQAEREHRIAETLQRSLLPDRLPDIPGVMLAARYVPATADVEVGGDWYDVVPLPNGHVALAIGDVAGHGLRAASIMGQLRMALRAYALEDAAPAAVIRRAHELVHRLLPTEMTTLIYLVFDPDSGIVRFANAGHPPPLVVGTAGAVRFVEEGLAPPLGTVPHPDHYREESFVLAGGATLLLFTDGLIERRGVSIQDGLTRLRDEVAGFDRDLDALCDHLLETMVGGETSDDVAMLALRPAPFAGRPLQLRLQAEPAALAPLRQTLRRWLREAGAERDVAEEILVAVGEACANVIRHAYGAREGPLEVGLGVEDGDVTVTIGDIGAWRPPSEAGGGRGLPMMRGFMDSVATETGAAGTVVRMRRRVTGGPIREPAREHDDPFGHGGTGP